MNYIPENLAGRRFGKLVVEPYYEQRRKPSGGTYVIWKCKCDCGNEKMVQASHLKSGNTTSCGCYRDSLAKHIKQKSKQVYNKYDLVSESYGIGYCTNAGVKFYFDFEDFTKIRDYKWYCRHGYIATTDKKGHTLFMHNLILPPKDNTVVIHINGKESLADNRKSNLKMCTKFEVAQEVSKKLRSTNTSGVVGVSKLLKGGWIAHITRNGVRKQKHFKRKDSAIRQRKLWEEEFEQAKKLQVDSNNES